MSLRVWSLSTLALLLLPTSAIGQQAATGAINSGQIERRIDETVPDREGRRDTREKSPEASPATKAPAEPAAPGILFTLAAVSISGATVFSPTDLAPLYEEFLATRITDTETAEIARRITQKYVEAGYILSQAIVPPQQVVTGVLQLRVIEGYVADVNISGIEPDRYMVAGFTQNIMAARPLTLSILERNILLIGDSAGMSVERSQFDNGNGNGAYVLNLDLSHAIVDATAYTDSRGTPAVGRSQLWLSSGVNQLLGIGDRIQAGYFTVPMQPKELQYGELQYSQPIGSNGFQARGSVSYSVVDAGSNQALTDTESETLRGSLQVTYPIVRARLSNLWLNGIFDYRNSTEDQLGELNFDDRMRVVRIRTNLTIRDDWEGTNWVIGTLSRGLDVFGASSAGSASLSRNDGIPDFLKFYLDIGRVQDIGSKYAIEISAIGQKSRDPLLSSEEIGLGGSRFGRAYDFAEITGDDGLSGSIEARRLFHTGDPFVDDIQLFGFFDIGAVWNRNPASAEFRRESLASTGVGFRAMLRSSINFSAVIAKPLTRPVFTSGNNNSLRAFFSLSADF